MVQQTAARRRPRSVTVIEGEGWGFAFTRKRDAVAFRARLPHAMLRPYLGALAIDYHAMGTVDPETGRLDPTFGGKVTPA